MKIIYLKWNRLIIILAILLILIVLVIFKPFARNYMGVFNSPTNVIVVGIDPGHGGVDPGAVSKNDVTEDKINLQIALKLKELVEASGSKAVLTREGDYGLYTEKSKTLRAKKTEDLQNRKKVIENNNCDVFLSIHLNSYRDRKQYGAQVFYEKGNEISLEFANIIQDELKSLLNNENKRRPQARDDIYLIKDQKMPSILVECGFLSNPNDEMLLQDEAYQYKIAWALYKGIVMFTNKQ